MGNPSKPECPYKPGLRLSIQRHVPPQPFGTGDYIADYRPLVSREEDPHTVIGTEWCLKYPLLETEPHPDTSVHSLELVDPMQCGEVRRGQVFTCRLDSDEELYVGKAYDALYQYDDDEADDLSCDITFTADSYYSIEAAAYEKLCEEGVNGRFSPKYYGSWSFSMPIPESNGCGVGAGVRQKNNGQAALLRSVRMILIQRIHGESLYRLAINGKIFSIPMEERLEMVATILETKSWLSHYGVAHRDFYARNVLLTEPTSSQSWKITVIDFDNTRLVDSPNAKYRRKKRKPPVNPGYHVRAGLGYGFDVLLPRNYRGYENQKYLRGWARKRWPDSPAYSQGIQSMNEQLCPPETEYEPPTPDAAYSVFVYKSSDGVDIKFLDVSKTGGTRQVKVIKGPAPDYPQ